MTNRSNTRVSILTLGCKLNQYESMGMSEQLKNAGYVLTDPKDGADVYIINTCTVTGKTDRRSRHAVRRVLKWNPEARIIVTGCGVQRDPGEFVDLPNVRVVAGNREKMHIQELVDNLADQQTKVQVKSIETAPFENIAIHKFGKYTRAFVKIQDGCQQHCSYCIIPRVRGPSRSQTPDRILQEIEQLVKSGFQEIVLTGIHLGLYGLDLSPATNLVALLKELVTINGLKRIRLSSIEPTKIFSELIDFIVTEPKICRHMHIPLQSGSDRILERMNRTYTTTEFSRLIHKIKNAVPDFCIGADVIVAFPGERVEQFDETCDFIRANPFDYLHVFTFSPRDGTPAASLGERVKPDEAKRRCHILRDLSRNKSIQFRESFIGRELPVLILASKDKNVELPVGLSDNYINVLLSGSVPETGTIVSARIENVLKGQTFGRLTTEPDPA
jgi:threonylcarbamoyladenosine tRNA methylthiotransferase MtaB